jgi:hypothetical protein
MTDKSYSTYPLHDYPPGGAAGASCIEADVAGSVVGWRSYTGCKATSGSSYGARLNHYISGAGGSGAAVRAYAFASDVAAANVYGAEVTAEVHADAASITGLMAAVKADVIINGTLAAGTFAALDLSFNVASGKSIRSAARHSFIRVGSSGSGTGANVFAEITTAVVSQDASALIASVKTAATNWTHGLRALLSDGTPVWFMLTTTTPAA